MTTLKSLREENGLTAAEVAVVLGVAISSYYNYERGEREIDLKKVLQLADLYNCSEREIILAQFNSCRSAQ